MCANGPPTSYLERQSFTPDAKSVTSRKPCGGGYHPFLVARRVKPQNTTTSFLFLKNSTGSKYLKESNIMQYYSHITHFNPPNPHTYMYVSCSRSNLLVQRVPIPP